MKIARVLAGVVILGAAVLVTVRALSDDGESAGASDVAASDPTDSTDAVTEPDASAASTESSPANESPAADVEVLRPMPELVGITDWLNTDGDSFESVRGDVTVLQFWTFGCSNCKATIPHLQELYEARRDDGLEIIGVHAHEFDYEQDPANVAQAVVDLGVTWPVALDTDKLSFVEWQGARRFWPRTYVIDGDNQIRFDHIGEGKYDELAATVDTLLAEPA